MGYSKAVVNCEGDNTIIFAEVNKRTNKIKKKSTFECTISIVQAVMKHLELAEDFQNNKECKYTAFDEDKKPFMVLHAYDPNVYELVRKDGE